MATTAKYIHRTDVELTFAENRARLLLEGRLLLNRMLNDALHQMDVSFQEALSQDELLAIYPGPEDLKRYLRFAAERELASASGS